MLCCGALFFFLYVGIWPWFWRGWKDVDDDDDGFSCSFESLSVAICLSSSLVTFFEVNHSLPYSLWSLKSVFHWHKSCTWLILLMASARFQSIKSPYVTINHERESKLDNKIPLQMERRILRGMKWQIFWVIKCSLQMTPFFLCFAIIWVSFKKFWT